MLPKRQESMPIEHPQRAGVKQFPIQGRHAPSGFRLGCVACNAKSEHKDSWSELKIATIHMCQKGALQKHLHSELHFVAMARYTNADPRLFV